MPPNILTSSARILYLLTALVAASIIAWVGLAGAGQPEAQCRGNSPKKVCPDLSPADGATVSGTVLVLAELPETVTSITFAVDDTPLGQPDLTAPYEAPWDTTKWPNGTHVVSATTLDSSGKSSTRDHKVNISNPTAPPPPPPGDTTAPTVGLTSPAAGATVSGPVSVSANASDNVGVVGVQFKLDGANLGSEDTSAPYSVSWDTTKTANGGHTLTAVARDAAGNSANSQRSVTVSNTSSSPPADTTAPTVGLTSPSAGATVSGPVSVSANASDNVGVVGVQFKLDGANLGSEDTSAPYSVSWDTTKTANGGHTLTAVARDAAGNSANSQRSVTVSNPTTSPPPSGSPLSWAPPALSNPVTINVSNANRRLFLDNSRDYRLNVVERLNRELWIEGGRNVVVIGGHITIDQLGGASSYQDNTALKIRAGDPSGTVHVEGFLIDGPYVNDAIAVATPRNVQVQNVRIERVYDNIKGGHSDCLQVQQGVGHLRMDRLTCTTGRAGIFLGDHNGPIRSADLRRVNIYSADGRQLLWQQTGTYPVSLSDFWLAMAPGFSAWSTFGFWVYPQEDGRVWDGTYDPNRRAQVSADGSYLTFVGSNNTISGRVNRGVPSGGDFVTRASVGSGYVSPGY
jgi:hypothetical protein